MAIDSSTMLRLEQMSALSLTGTDRIELAGQMEAVLSCLDVLRTCPDAPAQDVLSTCPVRADEVRPSTDRTALLSNAAQTDGEFFLVLRTVE